MTSQQSTLADRGGLAPAIERDIDRHRVSPDGSDPDSEPADDLVSDLTPFDQTIGAFAARETSAREAAPRESTAMGEHLDSSVVEELTRRLPTSVLVKIIKGALDCGRRNLPFTESDLLRTMTFGSSSVPVRRPVRGTRSPRG
jgi:hypothetical protein